MRLLCVIAATTCLCLSASAQTDTLADSVAAALSLPPPVSVAARYSRDLDGDGTLEILAITSEESVAGHPIGGEIILLKEIDGQLLPVWRRAGLNPWKLEIGDVDGDGPTEFAVGVWKTSPFDPVMAKRIFVYSWDGETVHPKWLGSRLARRFDDFILCDIDLDGWDELIALEIAESENHRVAAYRWHTFGFEWLGCSEEMPGICGLTVEDEIPIALAESDRFALRLVSDHVELEPVE